MGSARGFGIVFAILFSIIAAWPLWSGGEPRLWAIIVAALFAIVAWLMPALLQPLNKLWFRFGMLLGIVVTPLIMGILFFGIFVPMAIILKLLRKDLLSLKLSPDAESYWVLRDREERRMQSMKNQF